MTWPEKDENTLLYLTLMRHGRSRADDEGVHEGRYDSPLTAVGEEQARRRAEALQMQNLRFDAVICSSLQRAHSTARIVAAVLAAPPPEVDPDWMEFNNGPLAGLDEAEAMRLYPPPASRNPYEPFHGSGESEVDFHLRLGRAVQSVVRRGAGSYLVVAHGGSLNAALRMIAAIPVPLSGQGMWFAFSDTGYARLRYNLVKHQWLLLEMQP